MAAQYSILGREPQIKMPENKKSMLKRTHTLDAFSIIWAVKGSVFC